MRQVLASDGTISTNPLYQSWKLIDQNLASALYATISPSLLPYVLNLESCHAIWTTIQRRLQSTNPSKQLQLKSGLHNVQKGDKTTRGGRRPRSSVQCQICNRVGHSAFQCWYRTDLNYQPVQQAFLSADAPSSDDWFLDTGATSHLTSNLQHLQTPQTYTGSSQIQVGNGQLLPIANSGQGLLPTPSRKLQLSQILHVPHLSHNLLSVNKLTNENSCFIVFHANGFFIKDARTNQILLQGPCRQGLYPIELRPAASYSSTTHSTALHTKMIDPVLLHQRLGHPSPSTLQLLSAYFPTKRLVSSFHCSACLRAKSHRLPFSLSASKTKNVLELIHCDVWGPSPIVSNNGYKYYLLFVDDFTHYSWVYPLQLKSEAFTQFLHFKSTVENQFNKHIKTLRTDGGGEFVNKIFNAYLSRAGIVHQLTCPYTPQQNGVAERKHRHLIETVRSLLFHANLPTHFWFEALLTAVHTINWLPSKNSRNKSPFKLLHNSPPDYAHLKVFGCLCYPWIPTQLQHKFQPRSIPCLFLGYSDHTKGYKCFCISNGRMYLSRHVKFFESIFPSQTVPYTLSSNSPPKYSDIPSSLLVPATHTTPYPSTALSDHTFNSPHRPVPPTSTDSTSRTHKSHSSSSNSTNTQPTHPPTKHPMITRLRSGLLQPKKIFDLQHSIIPSNPTSYSEAHKHSVWRKAMSMEFEALQQQGTWVLVPPSPNFNVLGNKWLFRTKYNADGTLARHKARLVAKGFNQEFGLDYFDTFSPVAKFPTIHILFTVAISRQWSILQLDISNAFLHGQLEETVYMKQPQGFIDSNYPNHVCLLKKALYGLKQAPRQWFSTFTNFLTEFRFLVSAADPSILRYSKGAIQIYILVYVDDILLTGNHPSTIDYLLSALNSRFHMRNLGSVSNFLGLQVKHTSNGLHLSQALYAQTLLNKAGMKDCKPVLTPLPPRKQSCFMVCQKANYGG
ncbi:Retrovirus-related Pol polyprotein from transposon TNT 1-94 [Dendrobium catenatum]|uniref:Retrovirus-related Pol polyprotein from transposon TNT 1-94 n=1 Tax=Dendrobium catenatum TaxID=906689 RepID=A0A2I0W8S8_9ASPA|nr:Retrovirus-related Pol polyprotein from transposon TNT 1-94 [Dendrobium catenatum]